MVAPSTLADSRPGRRPVVLAVDDEPRNLRLMEACLAPRGYEVYTAEGGQEAIDLIPVLAPDVVLLDLQMPDVDGLEVLRRLRGDARTRMLPVVLVTALDDRENKMRGLEAGANDFLAKPVDQPELLARLQSLVSLKRTVDELQRSNEELARRHGQLTSLERFKDDLLRMIVHDLNNPLNCVMLQASALASAANDAPPEAREAASACVDASRDLEMMVQGILALAQLEKGQLEPRLRRLDVHSVVSSAVRLVRHRATARHIELETRLRAGDIYVWADADLLRRVLINLLDNALRHARSAVVVDVQLAPQGGEDGSTLCLLGVHDDGPGLPPDASAWIFEKGRQGRPTPEGGPVGRAGLGLAFCRLAVEAHGGRIEAGAGPRGGAEFRLSLPGGRSADASTDVEILR